MPQNYYKLCFSDGKFYANLRRSGEIVEVQWKNDGPWRKCGEVAEKNDRERWGVGKMRLIRVENLAGFESEDGLNATFIVTHTDAGDMSVPEAKCAEHELRMAAKLFPCKGSACLPNDLLQKMPWLGIPSKAQRRISSARKWFGLEATELDNEGLNALWTSGVTEAKKSSVPSKKVSQPLEATVDMKAQKRRRQKGEKGNGSIDQQQDIRDMGARKRRSSSFATDLLVQGSS